MKKIVASIIFLISLSFTTWGQSACQWAYIPTSAISYGYTIYNSALDLNGNLVQVGKIAGIADMDPGPGPTQISYSGTYANYFVSKTSISGALIWIKYFTSPVNINFFEFKGVEVNSNNEIVILGRYFGLVDFDVSPTGIDTLRSHHSTYPDYFVAKYDATGNYQWAFSIGNPGSVDIPAHAMKIQSNNNIVIAATPSGNSIDVDPSSAVHNSMGANGNIICYNTNGQYLWNNNVAINPSAGVATKSIDVDNAMNSYMLTVGYYELTVNKFNANGGRVWNKKIGNFASSARVTPLSLLVEHSTGNFYVAGTFGGTVDFDPNAATVNKSSSSGSFQDAFIAKYDSSMNLIWVRNFIGNSFFGNYGLDFSGNDIVAVGNLKGSIDFGNGIILTSTASIFNPFYIKMNSNGIVTNGYTLPVSGSYNAIQSTSNQSYHVAGQIMGSCDVDPTASVLTLTPNSTSTHFNAVHGTMPATNLNVKVFLQGYYSGSGNMNSTLLNQGVSIPSNYTDTIVVEIRNIVFPYNIVISSKAILNTNGNATSTFNPGIKGPYYVVIKHRNSIETWSANPITISEITNYDFTNSSSKAYGANLVEVEPNVWAIYSGDINQDGNIDLIDASLLEVDINNFEFGYFKTDINGDGNVDLIDIPIVENNINAFIYSIHP